MRALRLLPFLLLALAGCAEAGGVGHQGRSLSDAAQGFAGSFNRLNDAAYSA
jgi:Flp pilus assembly protein TadG